MRHLLITAMTLLLYPSVGFGQGSGHDRAAEGIYDSRDRQAETKSVIEALLGVYLVHPPRRHQSERVRSKRGHFTVDLWHPVGDSTDQELKTRAVQWLFFGRTQYAKGARAVFSECPDVKRLSLRFHEVIRPEIRGRRRTKRKEKINRYLSISLTRREFESMDVDELRECVERMDCRRVFDSRFKKKTFKRRYIQQRRREFN